MISQSAAATPRVGYHDVSMGIHREEWLLATQLASWTWALGCLGAGSSSTTCGRRDDAVDGDEVTEQLTPLAG
jgi:hypothetical protein